MYDSEVLFYNEMHCKCEEDIQIELPSFPRGKGKDAFAIFDLNISSDSWYHIDNLQWESDQNIIFNDSNINNIRILTEHFNKAHQANQCYSESAAIEIYNTVENIYRELKNKCEPSLKFSWKVKMKVSDVDCSNVRNSIYNTYHQDWKAYAEDVPFWHTDGSYDKHDYLITFALQGINTPLYKGDPYEVKMMNTYSPKKNVKITDKRVEIAKLGQATIINLPNCWHAIPCDKLPRLVVLIDAHKCTSSNIVTDIIDLLRF